VRGKTIVFVKAEVTETGAMSRSGVRTRIEPVDQSGGLGQPYPQKREFFAPRPVLAEHLNGQLQLVENRAGSTFIIEGHAQAYDFFKNGADIPRPTMRNSFVLVQWHGESSVRVTSLMI